MDRFDLLGPLPDRTLHHRAGGQRGHGQDVRAGRPGDALRRRGRGDAGPDAAHHVRPGGQPGAARAGAPPDRRRGSRFRRSRRASATTSWCSACSTGPTTSARPREQRLRDALAGFDAATIATTHQFCQLVLKSLGVAGDTDVPRHPGGEPRRSDHRDRRRPLPRPTSASSATIRCCSYGRRAQAGARGGRQPGRRAAAPRRRNPTRRPRSASTSRKTFWPNWKPASDGSASSATTTC